MPKLKTNADTSPMSGPLRRAIAESGIPLARLQRDTGIQRESIARFIRGETSLVLDKADRLAAHFGLGLVPTAAPEHGSDLRKQIR